MPQRKKLTNIGLKAIQLPEDGRVEYLDSVVPQLALRVTPNGTKSFAVRTRVAGKQVRVTLGEWPSTSLEEARQKARDALNDARRGISPTEEKRRARDAQREREANDFASVADLFIERYAKRKNRKWRETQRIFDKYVKPDWGHRPISDIKRADVAALLDKIEDTSGVYMANRVLAAVRKLFNWAMDERGIIEATPVGRRMAREGEEPRTRHLTDDEIRAIWAAAEETPYPFGPFAKLLLITGQRRDEVASMRWEEIEQGIWTMPAAKTKANREHRVPLPEMALQVLASVPTAGDGGYVFTTTGKTPISGFSKAKAKLDKLSGAADWRFHDLRATMATRMEAELHIPPHIIGAVLNHDPKRHAGVTAIYTRADPLDAKGRALNAWESLISRLLAQESGDKVLKLDAARK